MRTTSYSELRKNLASMLDSVSDDHEPIIITRDRGKPAAVLISLEDFASFEETQHLLKAAGYAALRRRSAWLAGGPALLLLLPTLVALRNYYVDPRYAREDMRGAARVLRAEAGEGELILGLGAPQVLTWYYPGPVPVEFVYDVWIHDAAGLPARVDGWAHDHRALWLCVSRPWLQDPQGRLKALLDGRFRVTRRLEFSGVTLTRYALDAPP